jgi:TldD protein
MKALFMKKRMLTALFVLTLFLVLPCVAQEPLMEVLKEELNLQMSELQSQDEPPFYMNYRVTDQISYSATASFGSLTANNEQRQRVFIPQLRLGSMELDNFRESDHGTGISRFTGPPTIHLPIEEPFNKLATAQVVQEEVIRRYKYAKEAINKVRTNMKVRVGPQDTSPSFTPVEVVQYYEPPLEADVVYWDKEKWENKVRDLSSVFTESPYMITGDAVIRYRIERRYFLSSEGTEIAENLTYASMQIRGMAMADDGMELPLTLSYFAFHPDDLPAEEEVKADTREMIRTLEAMRMAPVVDPYSGPAMLSGSASGVFFHEIFGHRIEGQKMKSETDGQTFKSMVGQYVLPAGFSVIMDPTAREYNGQALNGYYRFDDQGVRGERVDVVKNGILNDFLMTRVALEGFPRSNGHARADLGYDPVSRQSNLIVEAATVMTDAELRNALTQEILAQGREFGFFIKEVSGGFTQTGARAINAFNVTPLEVYKIFADGRPDELVRGVDLIGTPLSMFSNITSAGGATQIFTGTCGAASGSVPVTAISPSILVSRIELQRKGSSQDLPPVLERPAIQSDIE